MRSRSVCVYVCANLCGCRGVCWRARIIFIHRSLTNTLRAAVKASVAASLYMLFTGADFVIGKDFFFLLEGISSPIA